jgi:hypothetical protein
MRTDAGPNKLLGLALIEVTLTSTNTSLEIQDLSGDLESGETGSGVDGHAR